MGMLITAVPSLLGFLGVRIQWTTTCKMLRMWLHSNAECVYRPYADPWIPSFWYVDEMLWECNSLYQLACDASGLLCIVLLKVSEPIDDVKWGLKHYTPVIITMTIYWGLNHVPGAGPSIAPLYLTESFHKLQGCTWAGLPQLLPPCQPHFLFSLSLGFLSAQTHRTTGFSQAPGSCWWSLYLYIELSIYLSF